MSTGSPADVCPGSPELDVDMCTPKHADHQSGEAAVGEYDREHPTCKGEVTYQNEQFRSEK